MTDLSPPLLWSGAGRPLVAGVVPVAARCWWCASTCDLARPIADAIPDTFADRYLAAVPASPHVCAACAWTLCDQIALPMEMADAGIGKRLDVGGRLRVSVEGDDASRPRLFLRLADGRIGVWAVGRNAAADEPWLAARDALRLDPVGALAVVDASSLSAGATARFRNYHHLGTARSWRPLSNDGAGKAAIRVWLLDPPAEPFAAVIGDGQKHAAIRTPVSDGDVCTVGLVGIPVTYRPAALRVWLVAYEALIAAGADDDEIAAGRYSRGSVALAVAIRLHDAVVAPIRGSARIELCAFLRRPRKELTP